MCGGMMDSPFLNNDETITYILRAIFCSGSLSPQILHEATGVDIDTCIQFCACSLSEVMFGKPPKIGRKNKKKQEKKNL